MRRIAIENFGDLAEAHVTGMLAQRREPCRCLRARFGSVAVSIQIGRKRVTDGPRPDGALVIGGIARTLAALIAPPVAWIGGRERAEPVRSQELRGYNVQNPEHLFAIVENLVSESGGHQLVGAYGRVGSGIR